MQISHIFPGARKAAAEQITKLWKAQDWLDRRGYYLKLLYDESDLHIHTVPKPPPGGKVDLAQWVSNWTWPAKDCTTDDTIRHNAAVHEFYLLMLGFDIPEEITTEAEKKLPSLRVKAKFPNARDSYIYCGICGHRPKANESPNLGPVKWYDPDDGYKLGTLCVPCVGDVVLNERKPRPDDYCQQGEGGTPLVLDNTDEDVTELVYEK